MISYFPPPISTSKRLAIYCLWSPPLLSFSQLQCATVRWPFLSTNPFFNDSYRNQGVVWLSFKKKKTPSTHSCYCSYLTLVYMVNICMYICLPLYFIMHLYSYLTQCVFNETSSQNASTLIYYSSTLLVKILQSHVKLQLEDISTQHYLVIKRIIIVKITSYEYIKICNY